ncbi:hypothetical protein KP509_10G075300 [Ceratopteris richardii]|uniref:Sulfotransferase n=1 Tax=Ceratopteris richardii TaxID=49495 RepID=A0A8T2U0Q5_CERRI|nr:hypothetical protein KP509_10G075300 [Ceratopteris richardii]
MQREDAIVNELCVDAVFTGSKPFYKETAQRWLYRKPNLIWKLVILVALGIGGMYICISGVDKRVAYYREMISLTANNEIWTKGPCSKVNVAEMFSLHYFRESRLKRDECGCKPTNYFVILSMQRSGSGWFEALLNSHPNISSHGEIFSVERRRKSVTTMIPTLSTVYNLDWVSSASKNHCVTAVGLKWMLNQGVMEYKSEIAAYLKKNSISIIFLFRRNLVRRYISILANSFDQVAKQINGRHFAHVHSEEEAKVLAAYKPVVNLTFLIPYLKRVEEIIVDAQDSFKEIRHMTVYYEDLVSNQKKELRRVQKFLGVKPTQLNSQHVKVHTQPLQEQINNWKELEEFLKGTRYEIFLRGKDYG